MNLNKEDKIEIVENAISWIVVLGMLLYGVGKTVQFDGALEIEKTVSELTGMELMWAFYAYSNSFALTIGLFEIIGGILILIKRTRILGCLFTSAILVNVILQGTFYEVNTGALITAIIYQFLILIILWFNRNKLIRSVKVLVAFNKTKQSRAKFFIKTGIAFVLFIGLRILEYYITSKW